MDGSRQSSSSSPLPATHYDVRHMAEDEFEKLAVYMVPDVPCERGTEMRAHKTLPRSLTLKTSMVISTPNEKVCKLFDSGCKQHLLTMHCLREQTEGVWSTGVIPKGTRFGPFEGVSTPNSPNDAISWRYFWRVSTT